MKKFYCFNCQKEISPLSFGKWRFCPHCFRKVTDTGEGLYRVCDKCGANLPADATFCLKCGHGLNGNADRAPSQLMPISKTWVQYFFQISLFFLSIILAAGIIYISFYLLLFCLIICLAYYLYSNLRN